MAGSFTICSSRLLSVTIVEMCPTMDLIVILNTQGMLTVYRTLSWEKVLSKSSSELCDSGTSLPRAVSFCSSGKSIAVGCSEGELLVLDIATGEVLKAISPHGLLTRRGILFVTWVQNADNNLNSCSGCQLDGVVQMWRYGGVNLVDRTGMEEYVESGLGEIAENAVVESVFRSNESDMLLSLDEDNMLSGYIFGIFPLFTIQMNSADRLVGGSAHLTGVYVVSAQHLQALHVSPCNPQLNRSLMELDIGIFSDCKYRYRWLEHAASLYLMIQADFSKLQEMVTGHSRKWKDSTRVIIPKLSLLQTVLNGYQISMSPVQFMYTLVHCGMWHPAAQTAFSQHWNDQGISRLRSAVDATSHSIRKSLQMRAIPIATNIALRCRELLGLHEVISCSRVMTSSSCEARSVSAKERLSNLVRSSELLLFKLDETLKEAKAAQESMLSYLQFVSECSAQVAAANTPLSAASKSNPTMAPLYLKIFDPRAVRAAGSGPHAQAEAVTGTHLYAYLQDQELPAELVKSKESSSSSGGSKSTALALDTASLTSSDRADYIKEIFQTAEQFAWNSEESMDLEAAAEQQEAFSKRSLLQELKAAKEIFMTAFFLIHETACAEISTPTPSAVSVPVQVPSGQCGAEATLGLGAGRVACMTGIQGTHQSHVTCADDSLVSDFSLTARHSTDRIEGQSRAMSNEEESHSVQLESAALTAAIITTTGAGAGARGKSTVHADLVVLCRTLSREITKEKVVHVARVNLTSNKAHSASPGSQIKCVQKVALYIAPSPACQAGVHRIIPKETEEDQADGQDAMHDNAEWTSLEDDDSSADIEREKTAAIVCVGPAIEQGTDSNGLNTCLLLISLKDLLFTPVSVRGDSSTTSIQSPYLENRDALSVDYLLGLDAQVLGSSEGQVSFRERLLSLEIPEDKERIILESRASRGVVLVGVASGVGGAGSGGKVIVVDMELDEDDEEEAEEEDCEEDDDEDDAEVTEEDHEFDSGPHGGHDLDAMVIR